MSYRRLSALLLLLCLSCALVSAQGVTLTEEEYQAIATALREAETDLQTTRLISKAQGEKIKLLETSLAAQDETLKKLAEYQEMQSTIYKELETSYNALEIELWVTRGVSIAIILGGFGLFLLAN